jgi:hypothetical protein
MVERKQPGSFNRAFTYRRRRRALIGREAWLPLNKEGASFYGVLG